MHVKMVATLMFDPFFFSIGCSKFYSRGDLEPGGKKQPIVQGNYHMMFSDLKNVNRKGFRAWDFLCFESARLFTRH